MRRFYENVKAELREILSNYRTTIAGIIVICLSVYLIESAESVDASVITQIVAFLIIGLGLLAGKDIRNNK